MQYGEKNLVKLKRGRWYLTPSRHLLKILRFDFEKSNVIVHDYTMHQNDVYSIEVAPSLFTPAFRIGEVARMIGRSKDTLRKYEREGLIPKVNQYPLTSDGAASMRVYTFSGVADLVEFFERRPNPGRPAKKHYDAVNKSEVKAYLNSRFKQIRKDLL